MSKQATVELAWARNGAGNLSARHDGFCATIERIPYYKEVRLFIRKPETQEVEVRPGELVEVSGPLLSTVIYSSVGDAKRDALNQLRALGAGDQLGLFPEGGANKVSA